jgi:hypothetical protein
MKFRGTLYTVAVGTLCNSARIVSYELLHVWCKVYVHCLPFFPRFLSETGGRKKKTNTGSGVQRSQEVMPPGSTPVPSRHPALTKQRSKDSDGGSVNSISSEGSR